MTSLSWPLLTGQLKGWNGILRNPPDNLTHLGQSRYRRLFQWLAALADERFQPRRDPKNPHFKFDRFFRLTVGVLRLLVRW